MHAHKKYRLLYLAAAVMIALLVGTALDFSSRINRMIQRESYGFLQDVAMQSAVTVREKLEGDLRMLDGMATLLGDQPTLDTARWSDEQLRHPMFQQFLRIGVILADGSGYGQDVQGMDFSDRLYFRQAMQGRSVISDMLTDRITGLPSLTYAVPIWRDGQVLGILSAVIDADTFCKDLFEQPYMGRGYTYLLDRDGVVILGSEQAQLRTFDGLFSQIDAQEAQVLDMREKLRGSLPGQLEYTVADRQEVLSYVPLGRNNWFVVSALPVSVIRESTRSILLVTTLSVTVAAALLIAFLASLIFMRRRSEKRLFRMAYFDELTGLLNKNGFHRFAQKLPSRQPYVYCMLDLKRFRAVNERFGYTCGDELLRHVGGILQADCGPQELVSRFSGDIFHLLWQYDTRKALEARFQRLSQQTADYRFPGDADMRLQWGMGAYVVEQGVALDAMGDLAKLALETIRGHHAGGVAFYSEAIQGRLLAERALEDDMARALKNREFHLWLQPKYALETGAIASAEVLVRWQSPLRGMISPAQFIPLFERNGFIAELDLYMFRNTCAMLRRWIARDLEPLPVSVNQSRLSLFSDGHIEKLVESLERYQVPARLLIIEITESAFWGDSQRILEVVSRLHSLGFRISMDDFGSGYSSLNMLKDIPIDELKIDKNFFDFSANRQRGRVIVRNIVAMARDLRISVVAEGVETAEHVHLLRRTGCQLVQGYYFSKPVPMEDFEEMAFPKESATV